MSGRPELWADLWGLNSNPPAPKVVLGPKVDGGGWDWGAGRMKGSGPSRGGQGGIAAQSPKLAAPGLPPPQPVALPPSSQPSPQLRSLHTCLPPRPPAPGLP